VPTEAEKIVDGWAMVCVCALADIKTSLKSYNLIGCRIISIISPSRISKNIQNLPTKRDL
jgi:hypothetical protein